jgi:hypothetical protein
MSVRRLVAAIAALPLLSCALFEGSAWVYVDNGSAALIDMSVDGDKPVTAPAKGMALIKLRAGRHRFVVRRAGEVLYDQSREFPDSPTVAKYVLNPDASNRYTSKRVKYRARSWGQTPDLPMYPSEALKQAVVLKPDPWVPGRFDYVVGEAPPAQVSTKAGETPQPVDQLCRIAAADYDLVSSAKEAVATNPRTSMTAEAEGALGRVLDACPSPSWR